MTVYEPGHLGGKFLTTMFLGRPVDEGPDSLITRVPDGIALSQELGLGEKMVAPGPRGRCCTRGEVAAVP